LIFPWGTIWLHKNELKFEVVTIGREAQTRFYRIGSQDAMWTGTLLKKNITMTSATDSMKAGKFLVSLAVSASSRHPRIARNEGSMMEGLPSADWPLA
jgi:hypothetical protein